MMRGALFGILLLLSGTAAAMEPGERLQDPGQEARAEALFSELRCMVCQNQSILDSDAPLARDLRMLVRERVVAGDSPDTVKDFLVARYGDFVLLKPRLSAQTALLWAAPALVIGIGILVMMTSLRRRPAAETKPLTAEEAIRLAALNEPDVR